MRPRPRPSRSEIWIARLDPIEGREQGRHRPEFEQFRVAVKPPEGGVSEVSYVMPDQIRAISSGRLARRLGRVGPATLAQVEDRVRILLDL